MPPGRTRSIEGTGPLGRFAMSCWNAPTPRVTGTEISVAGLGLGEPSLASPLIEAGRRATVLLAKLRDAQTAGFFRVDSLLPHKAGILADGRAHDKGLQEDGIENHPHPLTPV